MPSSRTQEGGLVPSNNITADQSGLEPMVPLTPDLNFEKARTMAPTGFTSPHALALSATPRYFGMHSIHDCLRVS